MTDQIMNFKVIPVNNNTFIFVGGPNTGKSFFASKIGALQMDVSPSSTRTDQYGMTAFDEFEKKLTSVTLNTGKRPLVVFNVNDSTCEELVLEYLFTNHGVMPTRRKGGKK